MKYQISKVCLAFMYKQHTHTHMVYGALHILPYLFLDQNANNNAYSAPLRHEVWNVDHKRVVLGIYLCYNTFSHLWVPSQHYPEYDTFFLSIFFMNIFLGFTWSMAPFWRCYSSRWFLNLWGKLTSLFSVLVFILICESNLTDPGIWTLEINWYI